MENVENDKFQNLFERVLILYYFTVYRYHQFYSGGISKTKETTYSKYTGKID